MEGGSNVDGDESGGTSPSRQGAGIGIMSPRNLMAMAAESGIASGEKGYGIRGGPSLPGDLVAPPGRPGDWWPPSGSTLVILEASVALIFYIFFRNLLCTLSIGKI